MSSVFVVQVAACTLTASSITQDPLFIIALNAVPIEDWYRTWPSERTIMLRMTSKSLREAIDKIHPPAIVCLRNTCFWNILHNHTLDEKLQFAIIQLITLVTKCSITTLELEFCNIKFRMKELIKVLSMCTNLKKLIFINNVLDNYELASIVKSLEQSSLNYLDLSHNYIDCDGAKYFAQKFIQCKTLRHLDLSRNHILADGAISLAKMLVHCTALTLLNLGNNNINNGVIRLAEKLPQCRSLTHLDLSDNYINRNGAKSLAKKLPLCAVLAHLDLSCNCIGIAGAVSLSKVLEQCTSLNYLNLNNTGIQSTGIDRLEEVLRFLPGLYCTYNRLDFYHNSII